MMTAAYLLLQYYIEILIFFLAYRFFYGELRQRIWIPLSGGIVFIAFWLMTGHSNIALSRVVVHGLVLLSMFFWPKVEFRVRVSSTIILVFVVNCVTELLQTIAEAIMNFTSWLDGIDDSIIRLSVYILQLLMFTGIAVLKTEKTNAKESRSTSRVQYYIRCHIYGAVYVVCHIRTGVGTRSNRESQVSCVIHCNQYLCLHRSGAVRSVFHVHGKYE